MEPSFALTQTTMCSPVWSLPHSRKIRSPQTTGDECPPPGRVIFQLKSFSVHWAGMSASLRPRPLGPRKRGHWETFDTASELSREGGLSAAHRRGVMQAVIRANDNAICWEVV